MRKKSLTIVLMALLSFHVLTGCGKQEKTTDLQADDDNTIVKEELDVIVNKDEISESEENLVEEDDDTTIVESVKYDCKGEITTASPNSGLIQIDDMIFQYGAKFSEIDKEISESECTYVSEEYNLSSVVPAGEEVAIQYYKNDEKYFMIYIRNQEEETIELGECTVFTIYVKEDSTESAYYAGFKNDKMTYTSVKEIMGDYEPEKEIFGTGANSNKELGIMYTVPFQEEEMHIYFIFDGVSNDLISFMVSSRKASDASWPW